MSQPSLSTERLLLRPFYPEDAPALALVANDFGVFDTTVAVKHPFDLAAAYEWMAPLKDAYETGIRTTWAIILNKECGTGPLMGMVSLSTEEADQGVAELGYWLGSSYWRQGFATEAAEAAVTYAFEALGLIRLQAYHFTRNPASGHVLLKLGFKELCQRPQAVRKGNALEDIIIYDYLIGDYQAKKLRH